MNPRVGGLCFTVMEIMLYLQRNFDKLKLTWVNKSVES